MRGTIIRIMRIPLIDGMGQATGKFHDSNILLTVILYEIFQIIIYFLHCMHGINVHYNIILGCSFTLL